MDINRDKAAALGVTPQQVESALYDAFGEEQASTIYTDIAEYWVVFEVEPQYQLDPDALSRLYIASSINNTNGTPNLVPLSAVANISRSIGPTSISHVGQLPSVTISFNLAPGVSLGTAEARLDRVESDLHMPATITGVFNRHRAGVSIFVPGHDLLLHRSWRSLVIYIILGMPCIRFHPSHHHLVRIAIGVLAHCSR